MPVDLQDVQSLRDALRSRDYTSGCTHNFYHYPARFSPGIARSVIETFTKPGDWVMDPFMGGGTTVVEGLRLGRRVLGSDVNSIASFVTSVRTTPLSANDQEIVLRWAADTASVASLSADEFDVPPIRNLPQGVGMFMTGALELADRLPRPRQRAFARCALLRLGQVALDCRDFAAPRRARLAKRITSLVPEMLAGLDDLVEDCKRVGVSKNHVTGRRILLHSGAADLDPVSIMGSRKDRPVLVFTSPPYPGVHVLYNRWQYRGRRQTAAPYWIAGVPDGQPESFYMLGSRTPTGIKNYFAAIGESFRTVREFMRSDSVLVQLIGFSDISVQLPLYLQTMREAGFVESNLSPSAMRRTRLRRRVPNRKWYAKLQGAIDASSEVLLVHRPDSI